MEKDIKHIGIIAVTSEGASLIYKYICLESQKYLGKYRHPEISLHTFSFSEHLHFGDDRLEKWSSLIIKSIQKLERLEVDFVICPSNTPHEVYNLVLPHIHVPWLHIAEEVKKEAIKQKCENVLLLGTEFTFNSILYPDMFRDSGITLNLPSKKHQQTINQIIQTELILGTVTNESKEKIKEILSTYESKNDTVILGCTELPLIISQENTQMNILDSVSLLGDASIKKAIG